MKSPVRLLTVLSAVCLTLLFSSGALAEKTVTITFVGDCTLGGEDYLVNREGSFHDYARREGYGYFFEKMRAFFAQDDLTVANFEGVLKDDARGAANKTYCFRGPTDFARILPLAGIEAVNLDNNHTLDYGKVGKTGTIEALTAAGVGVFDELTPYIFEKDGIKIAFFGMQRVHFYSLREELTEKIRVLRQEEGVSAVVFTPHFGNEYATHHTNAQADVARKLIDMGADFVAGSHPHVVQGLEVYNGRYIFYSMGNFCFGGNLKVRALESCALRLTLTFDDDGAYLGQQLSVYAANVSGDPEVNDFQPRLVTGEAAQAVWARIDTDSEGQDGPVAQDGGRRDYAFLPR